MASFRRFGALLCVAYIGFHVDAAAAAMPKGCRVCTSSPCSSNGSGILLDAMKQLSSDRVDILETPCLGGCGSGVQVKPFDKTTATNNRRVTLSAVPSEEVAVSAAAEVLEGIGGLNIDSLNDLQTKLQAGERILNCEPPEMCLNCNSALQLYRGNCAKCGKYPY
mmetsp:Transcript_27252/g.45429  ORF Transcript_27252/g.45429 Transcript_27252/m.45429 type:complete len:165 (+) Transcript_27252:2-496(+)